MTDQPKPSLGTVAEEAARLISAMATMAGSREDANQSPNRDDPSQPSSPYAGEPAQEPAPPEAGDASRACSACGAESNGTPVACRLCPLCQGIALLRSVRPETVERLADFASAMAASLRDMATQSRASGPASQAGSRSGRPSGQATVQDIPVDDEDEGSPA
jgi:hypothetical protein